MTTVTANTEATKPTPAQYSESIARLAKQASSQLVSIPTSLKNQWLFASADQLDRQNATILQANALDLAEGTSNGLSPAAIDRLTLNALRIASIAQGLRQVASLPDPVGEILEGSVRPNGIRIEKVRVPLGVVFFIYESRPNVTADAAAICIKSGNAVILRGGKEARHSSQAIITILRAEAIRVGLPQNAIQLVESTDREIVGELLKHNRLIDVVIPRGGASLIERVTRDATMPVIKHFDGNCHVYVDSSADLAMAAKILVNSKCHRFGVCNAAESLLVHRDVAGEFLPQAAAALAAHHVEIRGDAEVCEILSHAVPATEADWSTEYLAPILSVRIVGSVEEAIEHINRYGSHHTDSIVTREIASADKFCQQVDSAAVMINASTRFNDGGEFGMGAEIGISTDKFHARGPCGLKELTSYKYIVRGNGQIRD